MDEKQKQQLIAKMQVKNSLKQEFEGTLDDRVSRYLQVKPHEIISNQHFAFPSTECGYLFRDGHYYGCIALTQSVTEALAKFLCIRNSFKPANKFETNVNKLYERQFISTKTKDSMFIIWQNRDSYHHLNPDIETDHHKLEELAKEKLGHLYEIEREIFEFNFINGGFNPKYPKYWNIKGDQTEGFLRFE